MTHYETCCFAGATLIRNSFLFSSFVIYMDFNKQWLGDSLGPFLSGAICSSLAWLTVWPLDVAKSRLQSGDFAGKPFRVLLLDVFASGTMFRGLLPGLARSAVANGCSMVVYKKVEQYLLMRREDSI